MGFRRENAGLDLMSDMILSWPVSVPVSGFRIFCRVGSGCRCFPLHIGDFCFLLAPRDFPFFKGKFTRDEAVEKFLVLILSSRRYTFSGIAVLSFMPLHSPNRTVVDSSLSVIRAG